MTLLDLLLALKPEQSVRVMGWCVNDSGTVNEILSCLRLKATYGYDGNNCIDTIVVRVYAAGSEMRSWLEITLVNSSEII